MDAGQGSKMRQALYVKAVTFSGRSNKRLVIIEKIGDIKIMTIMEVSIPFSEYMNRLNFRNIVLWVTSATEALKIMITGASMIRANENATPKAAKLTFESGSLAIRAVTKGSSHAIINQVSANGTQKRIILEYVRFIYICKKKGFPISS